MIAILCVVGTIVLVGLAWLAYELVTAPYGWQDSAGFHWGEQPRP